MSESLTPPTDPRIDTDEAAATPPAASNTSPTERGAASAPTLAAKSPPSDARAMLELIASALTPDADETTRASARDVCAQLAQSIATAPPNASTAPVPAAALSGALAMPAVPVMPTAPPPSSPLAAAARALRQMPPDQLLDLVLQRLRAALPAGTTMPTPNGIQFQLVPTLPPPPGER